MNESSLSKSIDQLATKKAEQFIETIYNDLQKLLSDKFRPKVANEVFVRDDILAILKQYIENTRTQNRIKPPPSQILIDGCRTVILDDLLKGLPKIKELLAMQDEE